jgi:hypothetical protein
MLFVVGALGVDKFNSHKKISWIVCSNVGINVGPNVHIVYRRCHLATLGGGGNAEGEISI